MEVVKPQEIYNVGETDASNVRVKRGKKFVISYKKKKKPAS